MNRITISGTDFAGLIRELRAKVTQHEGVNLDVNKLQMVKDADDNVLLRGVVVQPTYRAFINQDLTAPQPPKGASMQGDENENADENAMPTARKAYDNNAVAGEENESYELSASVLRKILSSISNEEGVFEFTDSGISIKVGNAQYSLSAKKVRSAVCVPQYTLDKKDTTSGKYFPIGYFEDNVLTTMLESAIKLSKKTGKSATLKGRAVHLVLDMDQMGILTQVEAVSSMAAIRISDKHNFTFLTDISKQNGGCMHFAISLPAAECLLEMLSDEGKKAYVAYDEDDECLIVWCGSYCISIATEDVRECEIPDTSDMTDGVSIACQQFLKMLSKVSTTGNNTVSILVQQNGYMEVTAPNGKYTAPWSGTAVGAMKEDATITLPLASITAIVQGIKTGNVRLMIDANSPYVKVTNEGEDIVGIVMKI